MLKHLRGLLIKVTKPNIQGDHFLQIIDNTSYYQIIPESTFNNKLQINYLKWRNRQVPRTDIGRDKLLDLKGKNVVDIGCNIGYMGWANALDFKSYIGIDHDSNCIKVAKILTEKLGFRNLKYKTTSFTSFITNNESLYDTCLFFSIYHHLLYQIGFEKARKLLKTLSRFCNEMYFDMGQKNEPCNPARLKWHRLLPNEEPEIFIKREVLENTFFNNSIVIGATIVGNSKRLLFKFTK